MCQPQKLKLYAHHNLFRASLDMMYTLGASNKSQSPVSMTELTYTPLKEPLTEIRTDTALLFCFLFDDYYLFFSHI